MVVLALLLHEPNESLIGPVWEKNTGDNEGADRLLSEEGGNQSIVILGLCVSLLAILLILAVLITVKSRRQSKHGQPSQYPATTGRNSSGHSLGWPPSPGSPPICSKPRPPPCQTPPPCHGAGAVWQQGWGRGVWHIVNAGIDQSE